MASTSPLPLQRPHRTPAHRRVSGCVTAVGPPHVTRVHRPATVALHDPGTRPRHDPLHIAVRHGVHLTSPAPAPSQNAHCSVTASSPCSWQLLDASVAGWAGAKSTADAGICGCVSHLEVREDCDASPRFRSGQQRDVWGASDSQQMLCQCAWSLHRAGAVC